MQYKKEYRKIGFRVIYDINPHIRNTISFAAHPYELLDELDMDMRESPEFFMVKGTASKGEELMVTFDGFRIMMSQDFHSRLGLLYEMVKIELEKVVLKKV